MIYYNTELNIMGIFNLNGMLEISFDNTVYMPLTYRWELVGYEL